MSAGQRRPAELAVELMAAWDAASQSPIQVEHRIHDQRVHRFEKLDALLGAAIRVWVRLKQRCDAVAQLNRGGRRRRQINPTQEVERHVVRIIAAHHSLLTSARVAARYVAAATSSPSRWLQRKAWLQRAAAILRPSDTTWAAPRDELRAHTSGAAHPDSQERE